MTKERRVPNVVEPDRVQFVAAWLNDELSLDEIGRLFGFSGATAANFAKRFGIWPRAKHTKKQNDGGDWDISEEEIYRRAAVIRARNNEALRAFIPAK